MVYVVRLLCMFRDCEPRIYVSLCYYVRVLMLDREAIYVSSYYYNCDVILGVHVGVACVCVSVCVCMCAVCVCVCVCVCGV